MIDTQRLRAEQLARASDVIRHDDLPFEQPVFIAGADVGFEQEGSVTRAAIAVMRYPSLELVEYKIARISTTMPYIPGFLSFRECPGLLAAWTLLEKNRTCCLSMGMGFPIHAVSVLPAILVYWLMCPRLAWRKVGFAAGLSRWQKASVASSPCWIRASRLVGYGVAKHAVIRCLWRRGIESVRIAHCTGYNVACAATVYRSRPVGLMLSHQIVPHLCVGNGSKRPTYCRKTLGIQA